MTGLPPEQQVIRDKCFHPTGTFVEFKKDDVEQSVPERFEQKAREYPDRLAVKSGSQQLTYHELNQAANQVAHSILDQGGTPSERVAFLIEQGITAVVTILGILKAGKTYVPIDPHFPKTRIIDLIDDSQSGLILTDERHLSMASDLAKGRSRVLEVSWEHRGAVAANPGVYVSPDYPAYIFYTSGSTGEPKGVVDSHRNVLHNIMRYTNSLHICPDDRLTLLHSCSLSATVSSLFSALLNGASVFPLNLQEESISSVEPWLARNEITVYHSVPSVFRQVATGKQNFLKLRLIRLEGDQVSPIDIGLFKKHFADGCLLVNGLGATECGIVRQYFLDKEAEIPKGVVPIGYAVGDMQLLLLRDHNDGDDDEDGSGEIAVRSRYLATGYWRNPELTRARFISTNNEEEGQRIYCTGDFGHIKADGCLEYLGRKDFQVKVRGNRVDVSGVEAVLRDTGLVNEAVVVAQDDERTNKRLIAYVVPEGKTRPTVSALRRSLAQTLPDYMVPSAFVILDAMPLTSAGKIDRRALPPVGTGRPNLDTFLVGPRTPIEKALAGIWAEVLGLGQVGVHDNFLDLGGDSLLAGQVVSRVIQTFQVEVPLRSLLVSPTISAMAVVILQSQTNEAKPEAIAEMLSELEALTDEKTKRLLSDENQSTMLGDI